MENCIFCKIVNQQSPAEIIYTDQHIVVFKDLYPKANTHVLLIPKVHIVNLFELTPAHQQIMTHLIYKIPEIARTLGLNGFRTIINSGKEGGQVIDHLHFHILSPVK